MREEQLFSTIRKGAEAREAIRKPGNETNPELVGEVEAARDAVGELFERNRGLVHHIAKRYEVPRELKEDLIQEGYLALVESLWSGKFDPDKGTFATYAGKMIEWACSRFYYSTVGSHLSGSDYTRKRAQRCFCELYDYERANPGAPEEDKCAHLGISKTTMDAYRRLMSDPVYLDQLVEADEEGDGKTVADAIGETDRYTGLESADEERVRKALDECLEGLPERQRSVLTQYYGLGGAKPKTIAQISRETLKSSETVRSDRDRAIESLSKAETAERLRWVARF